MEFGRNSTTEKSGVIAGQLTVSWFLRVYERLVIGLRLPDPEFALVPCPSPEARGAGPSGTPPPQWCQTAVLASPSRPVPSPAPPAPWPGRSAPSRRAPGMWPASPGGPRSHTARQCGRLPSPGYRPRGCPRTSGGTPLPWPGACSLLSPCAGG